MYTGRLGKAVGPKDIISRDNQNPGNASDLSGASALPLLNDLHFQVVPERFWNLNGAVSLLIGFD
jgi:hypothetical protein